MSAPASYGIPTGDKTPTFPDEPTLKSVPCFFGTDQLAFKPFLNEPVNTYTGAMEISLPVGTEITKGDKIVDVRFGHEYTASYPENIRGKYLSLTIYRTSEQERL